MSDYRRWYVPGGTYFFTVVVYKRRKLFAMAKWRDLLGESFREVRKELPFETVAMVLLPDHMHVVWTLPRGDEDYSERWKRIKNRFTQDYLANGGFELPVSAAQEARGTRGIWQRRFWEHVIRDEIDLSNHCDYIHYNPVKHGYVRSPAEWPYSTFGRFVEAGQYPLGWGRSEPASITGLECEWGE